jgi:hypothetical protein
MWSPRVLWIPHCLGIRFKVAVSDVSFMHQPRSTPQN